MFGDLFSKHFCFAIYYFTYVNVLYILYVWQSMTDFHTITITTLAFSNLSIYCWTTDPRPFYWLACQRYEGDRWRTESPSSSSNSTGSFASILPRRIVVCNKHKLARASHHHVVLNQLIYFRLPAVFAVILSFPRRNKWYKKPRCHCKYPWLYCSKNSKPLSHSIARCLIIPF